MLDLTNKAGSIDHNLAEFLRKHPISNIYAIDGVIEILRAPLPPGWGPTSVKVEIARNGEYPLDPQAVELLTPYRDKLIGLGWETKHRVAALEVTSSENPVLRVVFVPTSYEEGTGFHRSLTGLTTERDNLASTVRERLASQLVQLGQYSVPGVAVVHALVVTCDNYLVLCQRSPYAGYHPSHWSVSFEEQINQKDLAFGNGALSAAAIRGFQEEFASGDVVALNNAHILGIFLEYNILNIGFCMYIEAPLSFEEIKFNWNTKAKDKWEAVTMAGEPFTLDNVARLLRSSHYGEPGEKRSKFHSTSKYRLMLAAINRFGWNATNEMCKFL